MTEQEDDANTALKLTTMAVSTVHHLRMVGVTTDIDIEVSDRLDVAEQTEVTTIRVRVKGNGNG